MSGVMYADGVDLSTLGFQVTNLFAWRDGPVREYESVQVPGRIESAVSDCAVVEPRTLQVRGLVYGDTAAERVTNARKIVAAVSGDRTLRFGDAAQTIATRFRGHQMAPIAAADEFRANVGTVLTLDFLCPENAYRDASSSVINLSASPTAIPLGDLPSGGVVRIDGPATNPKIVYRTSMGAEVASIELTASLGSGGWIEVDLDKCRITTSLATNPMMLMTGGKWFRLSHTHGNYATSSWPTLEITSGTGSLTYVKRFSV